jgi:hypothetical protein
MFEPLFRAVSLTPTDGDGFPLHTINDDIL